MIHWYVLTITFALKCLILTGLAQPFRTENMRMMNFVIATLSLYQLGYLLAFRLCGNANLLVLSATNYNPNL